MMKSNTPIIILLSPRTRRHARTQHHCRGCSHQPEHCRTTGLLFALSLINIKHLHSGEYPGPYFRTYKTLWQVQSCWDLFKFCCLADYPVLPGRTPQPPSDWMGSVHLCRGLLIASRPRSFLLGYTYSPGPTLLPLPTYWGHCAPGTLWAGETLIYPWPDLCLVTISLWRSTESSLRFISSWHAGWHVCVFSKWCPIT